MLSGVLRVIYIPGVELGKQFLTSELTGVTRSQAPDFERAVARDRDPRADCPPSPAPGVDGALVFARTNHSDRPRVAAVSVARRISRRSGLGERRARRRRGRAEAVVVLDALDQVLALVERAERLHER